MRKHDVCDVLWADLLTSEAVQQCATMELATAAHHRPRSVADAGVDQYQAVASSAHQESTQRELQLAVRIQELSMWSPLLRRRALEGSDRCLHHAVEYGFDDEV